MNAFDAIKSLAAQAGIVVFMADDVFVARSEKLGEAHYVLTVEGLVESVGQMIAMAVPTYFTRR